MFVVVFLLNYVFLDVNCWSQFLMMVWIPEGLRKRFEGILLVLEMKQRLWYYIALNEISRVVDRRWFVD